MSTHSNEEETKQQPIKSEHGNEEVKEEDIKEEDLQEEKVKEVEELEEEEVEEEVKTLTEEEKSSILRKAENYLRANIRLISACQDEQQTIDCSNVQMRFGLRKSKRGSMAVGLDGGACTSVLLKILYQYASSPDDNGVPTFTALLEQIRRRLKKKGYKQIPALTASRPCSMNDEFSVIPKNFNGTRKALVIGIRYKGALELPGCHNDCWNMIKYLKTVHGFQDEDITILIDDDIHTCPTRANIVAAFHRFAFSVKPGDAVFFHYAGHGSSTVDKSGDEKSGFDQTLLPCDYIEKGAIIDDEIFRILLIPLPKGVEMTAIVDACHSGTIFDLPFEFIGDERYETGSEMDLRKVTFPHMKMVNTERKRIIMTKELLKRASQVERVMVVPEIKKPKKQPPKKHAPKSFNKTNSTMGSSDHTGASETRRKKGKPQSDREENPSTQIAVPEATPTPKNKVEETATEVSNCLFGGCLLCLNPCKMFRVLS